VRRRGVRLTLAERGRAVDTHRGTAVSFAFLESTGSIVGRHHPCATHLVVDVLTPFRCLRTVLASTEAELRIGHEVRPLVELLELPESRGENKSTDGVTDTSCSVGVELTSLITLGNVEGSQITSTGDLNKVGGLDEMGAVDGTVGNQTRSIALF